MTDKRELKPCPFCRRPGRLDNDMPNAVVGCSATTHSCPGIAACVSSSADEAITAWNTRLASGDAVKQLAEAIFHNGPVLVDTMGDDLAWQDDHRNWHILTTEAPASDEKGKVRDTPGLRASRESLGITQDEQRRRAMAAASRMKAEGTASKPGPATTEAPAQTEAMALAAIRTFLDVARQNIYPCPDKPDSLWGKWQAANEALATLRQPASVEAEPVAWRYDWPDQEMGHVLSAERWDEGSRKGWTETPLYVHPSADVTALLGDVRRWYGRCESETGCDYLNGEAGHGDAWDDMKAICSRIHAHLADQVQS